MEIRFCDICNQSISKAHFDEGRAVLRADGGACVVSSAPGEALARERPRFDRWAPAAVAILFATALAWFAVDRVERAERDSVRERTIGTRRNAALLEDLRREFASAEQSRSLLESALVAELNRLRDEGREGRVRLEQLDVAGQRLIGELETQLADLGTRPGGEPPGAMGSEALAASVTSLGERLEELRGELRAALAAPGSSDAAGGSEAGAVPWIARLSDPDPLVRWNAVDQLSRGADPALAGSLVALLTDPDLLVRVATARALGMLGNLEAAPGLIGALEDTQPAVREAAVLSLRSLSGRSFRFDPVGAEAERARRVDDWRDWWKREGGSTGGR
jgi:hypothetical protein